MSTLEEDIWGIILKALPNLSEETKSRLESSGLESKEDLEYVQQEDLTDLLPVIQLRKLLKAFKSETEMVTLDLQIIPNPTTLSSPSPLGSCFPTVQCIITSSYIVLIRPEQPKQQITHIQNMARKVQSAVGPNGARNPFSHCEYKETDPC
ncbi:unnamed protein product [Pleuronectes platessa]|uniref:Uncharacterized protein n=1 Tax=Pleuronectes platessa TaxID=8262 RepID=A0A9N7Z650_PLEPL|nr:unnamed protein product [Pleuronectes platessa]